MTQRTIIRSFDDATQFIEEIGILPFSDFLPNHPSLSATTLKEMWHTGADGDPWLWRDRFGTTGAAAYGRFFRDKPILVSKDLFPIFRCSLQSTNKTDKSADELRVQTSLIYEMIQLNPGIDVKDLRKLSEMDDPAYKKTFNRILIRLQNTSDILISGISDKLIDNGVKSGWNSTCYMTSEEWMGRHNITPSTLRPEQARDDLLTWCASRWEPEACQMLRKLISKS